MHLWCETSIQVPKELSINRLMTKYTESTGNKICSRENTCQCHEVFSVFLYSHLQSSISSFTDLWSCWHKCSIFQPQYFSRKSLKIIFINCKGHIAHNGTNWSIRCIRSGLNITVTFFAYKSVQLLFHQSCLAEYVIVWWL